MIAEPQDVNHRLITVARRHRYLAGQLLAGIGIHPGQDALLRALWSRGSQSQTELADALGVELPTVIASLASLERNGFVSRHRSERDRRAITVELTTAGRRLQPALQRTWDALEDRALDGFSANQRRQLERLLDKLANNLARPDAHPEAVAQPDARRPPRRAVPDPQASTTTNKSSH